MSEYKYKVLVAEDEDPFREEIISILKNYPEIDEITEVTDGGTLRIELLNNHFDIAFLDIDLPVCTSLEALPPDAKHMPVLVFITAYDEYISDAFDLKAADYILKPFDRKKINRSVMKAFSMVEKKKKQKSVENIKGVIWLKDENERLVPVTLSSIIYLESKSGITFVYTDKNKMISSKSLKDFYDILNPKHFVYAHRSYIVRYNSISHLEILSNNIGEITMINRPEKIPVSRRFLKEIKRHIY